MQLNCVSFNVLADDYLTDGDYRHVQPDLLKPGARTPHMLRTIADLRADVVGLQEVEFAVAAAFAATGNWQTLWSPKRNSKPDGCLTLVKRGIFVTDFATYAYDDGTSHLMQLVIIDDVAFANTHIIWAPADTPDHPGVSQTRKLLERLSEWPRAVIFADCNDRPGGPVRALVEAAGFNNVCGDEPTARIGDELAALDIIAVRGIHAERIATAAPDDIPNTTCPSDHIPVMARVETT